MVSIKERIEFATEQKEIKKIWSAHKIKLISLTPQELEILKVKAELHRVELN